MNDCFESFIPVKKTGGPKGPRSIFSRMRGNPLMPATLWETKARFERMRKLLYKYEEECRYIFPQNDEEALVVSQSKNTVSVMIQVLTDVLQKKRVEK